MRKLIKLALLANVILLGIDSAFSQTSSGGFPIEPEKKSLKAATILPCIEMPETDFTEDMNKKSFCKGKIFAHKFNVNINVKEKAEHSETDTYNIWRLLIKSKDARSLNLIFSSFIVPEGARLFLYTPDKEQMLGAYTNKNNTDRRFAISPIDGDAVVVCYEEPKNARFAANLVIDNVNHDFRGLKLLPQYGISNDCEVNAATDTVHLTRQSSCLLVVDGIEMCSGNLVNNTQNDANPYIISSGHCFWNTDSRGNTIVDTNRVTTTVAFFNYESPSEAWPIEGSKEMSISGGRAIAWRLKNDMMLIRMNEVPPVDYRTYQAGWSNERTLEGPLYTFHHPGGDVKKISVDNDNPSTRSFDNFFTKNVHWRLYRWDSGMTEGGSSGCGLFNSENLLVGNLTGGDTASKCSRPGDDYFWKICDVWNDNNSEKQNLGFWLDPLQTGVTVHNGMWTYSNPCKRITHRAYNEVPAVPNIKDNEFEVGTNTLGMTEFAERFSLGHVSTLYGVYFFPVVGFESNKSPIFLRIYKGKECPDSLIYEQRIHIQNALYDITRKEFQDRTVTNWGSKENYVRLETPIEVDSTFFVAFTTPTKATYGNNSNFALYFSEPKASRQENTAYFKGKDGWQDFTQHPTIAKATSIMTDAVVREGWNLTDSIAKPVVPVAPPTHETEKVEDYNFYPAVTKGEIYLDIPRGDMLKSVCITDMNGRTLYVANGLCETSHYVLNISDICPMESVYNLVAEYKFMSKTFRFIRWKTK